MGVAVLHIFPDASRSGCVETEKLHKRIMHLDALQCGMFTVDCDTYYTTAQTAGGGVRKMHIVHNSDTPTTTYAILETPSKQVTLSADFLFDLLLPRLDHMYQAKKNLKIESKGAKYEIGDFLVKIGTVTMSGHYKGILVEVEYLPCVTPALCWSLIREFMQSFMGSCVKPTPPTYLQNHYNDIHTAQDTVRQYVEKFNEFREGPNFGGSQSSGTAN
ncbi:mediator of RNA polymerase II transcription subunit 20 isoform X3 [Procambarus clarkii]|uniref:mediator of RNA polymerase II transcription subunit 20 isoform X3 n=1 Tax=Procambarus clarkii TaxID=6728 RepID=UPI001E671D29|nr:mediator of RNA polymerase II transcription subunit 20-like isoform X3 [Procambarus clarkii]